MIKVVIVHTKGEDFENVEAFLDSGNLAGHASKIAEDYLAAELEFPGVKGRIITIYLERL